MKCLLEFLHDQGITPMRENKIEIKEWITIDQFVILHAVCPNCGSKEYTTTLIGYVEQEGVDFEDHNQVSCLQCPWEGTTMELVE